MTSALGSPLGAGRIGRWELDMIVRSVVRHNSCVTLCSNSYYYTVKNIYRCSGGSGLVERAMEGVTHPSYQPNSQPNSQPGALNVNSQGWTSLLVNFSRRVSSQPDHPANFEDLCSSSSPVGRLSSRRVVATNSLFTSLIHEIIIRGEDRGPGLQ